MDLGDTDKTYEAYIYLTIVAAFLDQLATILTFIAMLEIGLGFLFLQKPPQGCVTVANANDGDNDIQQIQNTDSSKEANQRHHNYFHYYKVARLAGALVGFILFVLAVACLGKFCSMYAFDGYYYYDYDLDDLHTVRNLGAAFDIIVWILTLPLIGFASYLVHFARLQRQPSRRATVLLLVATLVWFVRYTWRLAYNAAFLLPPDSYGAPLWSYVANPLLSTWPLYVVLVLLYVIVSRRARGLWSTSQPWMAQSSGVAGPANGPAYEPVYNPAGYGQGGYAALGGYKYTPPVLVSPQQQQLESQPHLQPQAPQEEVYQLPSHEQQNFQPHTIHEMYQPQPLPQEMHASQPYVQQQQEQPHTAVVQMAPMIVTPPPVFKA
ncbi:MAG: hypothetical protein STHCBS139747_004733 [Sporothrix thermara]